MNLQTVLNAGSFLDFLNTEIRDTQAELDDFEMFGGDPEKEAALRIQLASLQDAKAQELARKYGQEANPGTITLENGNTITPSPNGGWGRLHYVQYAMGSRKYGRDFWICAGCGQRIPKGVEHYKRSYYADKDDNRSGSQIRLCMECYADHEEQHPCSTTFPVRVPARRKPDARRQPEQARKAA